MPSQDRTWSETADSVGLRRVPETPRGQANFDRILAGALEILADEGLEHLTTRRIVERTGVNVSAVYQFFPNKEAILLAAFDRWSTQVMAALDRAEAEALGQVELLAFLDRILAELHAFDMDLRIWLSLHRAMKTYVLLVPAERAHADAVAERLARYMKVYGSPWSDEGLVEFGHIAYEYDCMMVERLARGDPASFAAAFELGRAGAQRLFERVMEPEPPRPSDAPSSETEP